MHLCISYRNGGGIWDSWWNNLESTVLADKNYLSRTVVLLAVKLEPAGEVLEMCPSLMKFWVEKLELFHLDMLMNREKIMKAPAHMENRQSIKRGCWYDNNEPSTSRGPEGLVSGKKNIKISS